MLNKLFIRKKNRKSVKQWEIINFQPNTFKNPNNVDIKSVITEHPKASHKLSNTIRQAEKVGSINKKKKITKWEHSFKGYASTHNVETLNSFKH